MSLSPTRYRDAQAIPETGRFQRDSILSITDDEAMNGISMTTSIRTTTHRLLLSAPRETRTKSAFPTRHLTLKFKFAIHLYNDHSCSLNDAISPTREYKRRRKNTLTIKWNRWGSIDKSYARDNRLIASKSTRCSSCLAPRCRLILSSG